MYLETAHENHLQAKMYVKNIFNENNKIIEEHTIKKNKVIISKGDQANGIYLLEKGLVGITHINTVSKEPALCGFFYVDDVIVTTSFLDRHPVRFNIVALKDCSIKYLDRNNFRNLNSAYKDFTFSLYKISNSIMNKFMYHFSLTSYNIKERFPLQCAAERVDEVFLIHNRKLLATFFGCSERTLNDLINSQNSLYI